MFEPEFGVFKKEMKFQYIINPLAPELFFLFQDTLYIKCE